VKRTEREAYH